MQLEDLRLHLLPDPAHTREAILRLVVLQQEEYPHVVHHQLVLAEVVAVADLQAEAAVAEVAVDNFSTKM